MALATTSVDVKERGVSPVQDVFTHDASTVCDIVVNVPKPPPKPQSEEAVAQSCSKKHYADATTQSDIGLYIHDNEKRPVAVFKVLVFLSVRYKTRFTYRFFRT